MNQTRPDYTYDKAFCQLIGFRFIKNSEFAGNTEELLSEFCRRSVLHCTCVDNENGRKCDDNTCIRRASNMECDRASCGHTCTNNQIGCGLYPKYLQMSSVEAYGKAVITLQPIPAGTRFVEYVGKVQGGSVEKNQFFAFPITWPGLTNDIFVNSLKEGNQTRFFPHSMTANCKVVPWIVGQQIRLVVTACRDIKAEEVLTIRYPQHVGSGVHIYLEEEHFPAIINATGEVN